jgi:hypothetical protein
VPLNTHPSTLKYSNCPSVTTFQACFSAPFRTGIIEMDTSDHLNAKDKIKLLLSELQKVGAGYNSGGLTSWSCCADVTIAPKQGPGSAGELGRVLRELTSSADNEEEEQSYICTVSMQPVAQIAAFNC